MDLGGKYEVTSSEVRHGVTFHVARELTTGQQVQIRALPVSVLTIEPPYTPELIASRFRLMGELSGQVIEAAVDAATGEAYIVTAEAGAKSAEAAAAGATPGRSSAAGATSDATTVTFFHAERGPISQDAPTQAFYVKSERMQPGTSEILEAQPEGGASTLGQNASLGFTDLFAAKHPATPAPPPPAQPAVSSGDESFSAFFRTPKQPEAPAVAVPEQPRSGGGSFSAFFGAPSGSPPAAPATQRPPEPAAKSSESFSEFFRTPLSSAPPATPSGESKVREAKKEPEGFSAFFRPAKSAASPSNDAPAPAPAGKPVESFSAFFRPSESAKSPASSATTPEPRPPSETIQNFVGKTSASYAQPGPPPAPAFSAPKPAESPMAPVANAHEPGEFTQFIRQQREPKPPAPQRSSPPAGDFTGFLQEQQAAPLSPPATISPRSAPAPAAEEPGSFTAMIQQSQPPAVPAAAPQATPAAAEPGSFTAMLQQQREATPAPKAAPAAASAGAGEFTRFMRGVAPAAPASESGSSNPGGFTDFFGASASRATAASAPSSSPGDFAAERPMEPARSPFAPSSGASMFNIPAAPPDAPRPGGVTQLFRGPGGGRSAPAGEKNEALRPPEERAGAGAPLTAHMPALTPTAPEPPSAPKGPGAYTRIIRGPQQAGPAADAPVGLSSDGGFPQMRPGAPAPMQPPASPFAPPVGTSGVLAAPVFPGMAAPQAQMPPGYPPQYVPPQPQFQAPQYQPPQWQPPVPPPAAMPQPPAPAATSGKPAWLVPLIVFNVLFILAIVLVLIFALKK